jgi:hypothetical protein
LVFLSGPGYRLGLLELSAAFTLLRWGAYLGLASVPLIIGYAFWQRPQGRVTSVLAFSALAGLIAFYIPFSQMQNARSVPPIHDISTDLVDPPAFVDIIPLRRDAPNPADYAGEETAQQQRAAYPEIVTLRVDYPLDPVFDAAQEVVRARGWELVSVSRTGELARIEATDTTFWFGFKDDLVIRITTTGEGTQVDVRSKSRVGRSDLGVNAERIQQFLAALRAQLAEKT